MGPIRLWLPVVGALFEETALQANDVVIVTRTDSGSLFQFRRGDVFLITAFEGDERHPVQGRVIEAYFERLESTSDHVQTLLDASLGLETLTCRERPKKAHGATAWLASALPPATEVVYVEFRVVVCDRLSA